MIALIVLGVFTLGFIVGASIGGVSAMAAAVVGIFLGCMMALKFWRMGRG